jgi:hypothetical protein
VCIKQTFSVISRGDGFATDGSRQNIGKFEWVIDGSVSSFSTADPVEDPGSEVLVSVRTVERPRCWMAQPGSGWYSTMRLRISRGALEFRDGVPPVRSL